MISKTTLMKLWYAFLVSPLFATISFLFQPLYVLVSSEQEFFAMLSFAILIDLIVGALKYWKLNKFSFKEMLIGLLIKVIVAYGGMILFLSFSTLEDGWVAEWFLLVARFTVLMYPSGSALTNMYILTERKFPPISFMKKFKSFEEISKAISKEIVEHEENKS